MQPHAAATMLLCHYVWNTSYGSTVEIPKKASVFFSMRRPNNQLKPSINMYFDYEDFKILEHDDGFIMKFRVTVRRYGHCTVTVTRVHGQTVSNPTIYFEHSEQHKAGLREKFVLYNNSLRGAHEGGFKFRGFEASGFSNDSKKVVIYSKIFWPIAKKEVTVPYTAEFASALPKKITASVYKKTLMPDFKKLIGIKKKAP